MLIDTTLYLNGQLRLSRAYRQGTNTLTCVPTNAQVNVPSGRILKMVDHVLTTYGDKLDPIEAFANIAKSLK